MCCHATFGVDMDIDTFLLKKSWLHPFYECEECMHVELDTHLDDTDDTTIERSTMEPMYRVVRYEASLESNFLPLYPGPPLILPGTQWPKPRFYPNG